MPNELRFTVFVEAGFDEDGIWVIDARLSWRNGIVPLSSGRLLSPRVGRLFSPLFT